MTPFIGFVMWFTLMIAYALFLINWIIASPLQPGINQTYFPGQTLEPIINQGINWGITFGRAIGSFLVGWAIAKFTHKWTSMIALGLTLLGILSVFSPTYAGFIILRTLLAIGGTVLIVLFQPIISNYFKPKSKAVLSILNPWAANFGTIIALIPAAVAGVFLTNARSNWQTVLLIVSALQILPFLVYLIFAQRFDGFNAYKLKQAEIMKNFPAVKVSFWQLMKKRDTWLWCLIYGSWLVLAVMPLTFNTTILPSFIKQAGFNGGSGQIIVIWIIIYFSAVLVSPFLIGWWTRTNYKRKPFVIILLIITLLLYILSIVVYIYMVGKNQSPWLFYLLGFFCGIFMWGVQGVMLTLPHEAKGTNPRIIGYQFSIIWGLGYFFFTLFTIIGSFVLKAPNGTLGFLIFYIVIVLICPILMLVFKETKPDGKLFPSWNTVKKSL